MSNASNWTSPGYPVIVRATGAAGLVAQVNGGESRVIIKGEWDWYDASDLDPDMSVRDRRDTIGRS